MPSTASRSFFRNLSLSTTGGRFAFASDQGREWGTPHTEKRIAVEVWELAEPRRVQTLDLIWTTDLAWLKGSERLAFVRYVRPEDVPPELPDPPSANRASWPADKVPVVEVLDVATGKCEPLRVGRKPLSSPDGKSLIVEVGDAWEWVDLETGNGRLLDAPGLLRPIGLLTSRRLVYAGLPTEGAEPRKLVTL